MPEITKSTEIIVKSREFNSYNDLLFTDTDGNNYKVSNKRVQYVDNAIQEGRLVKLNWSTAYNRDYIYNAELLGDDIAHSPPEESPLVKHALKEGAEIAKPSGQEVGMTTKEIGDMIRADKLSVIFGAEPAKELVEWYKNRIKGTTGVK